MIFPKSTYDLDLEIKALSYLISDTTNFFDLVTLDFSNNLHQRVFKELIARQTITYSGLITLGLTENTASMLFEIHIYSSAEMDRVSKQLRQMTKARKEIWNAHQTIEKITSCAPSELQNVVGDITLREHIYTPEKALERMKNEVLPESICFEPNSINDVLKYFSPGWVCFVVASMGVGKTSAGIQIGRSIAECEGSFTFFVSLEMEFVSFYERCYSIRYYELNPEADYNDWLRHRKNLKFQDMTELAIHPNEILMDKRSASISEIKQTAQKLIAQGKNIKTIVIDHIYILRSESDDKTENESQIKLAAALDALAKDLSVRVLALCQTIKKQGDQKYMEPYITDIRGSKSLGEICSWALMLWRDIDDPRKILWKTEKYRYGKDGRGYLLRNGTHFYDDPTANYNPGNY